MEKHYGFGSVYRRESDGLWVAAVELPRRRGEKRKRKVWANVSREVVETKLHAFRSDNPAVEHVGRTENLRRARRLGTHTSAEWWRLVRESRCHCAYCCKRVPLDEITQDHRTPLSRGGSDAVDNLALTCPDCNRDKGTMTEGEYRDWMESRA